MGSVPVGSRQLRDATPRGELAVRLRWSARAPHALPGLQIIRNVCYEVAYVELWVAGYVVVCLMKFDYV